MVDSWSTYDTVWAKIKPISGSESNNQEIVTATGKFEITIRHNDSVTTKDRVYFDSRTFEINEITDFMERDIYQILICTEVK